MSRDFLDWPFFEPRHRAFANELDAWATSIEVPTPGELDGSEPVDDRPAGFATWDDWRRHRWPPSV
jgi:hypothetical protein